MSKKKQTSAKKTRAKSASRRKTASRPRRRAVKRTTSTPKVQLKPIWVLIDRAIANLQKLPPTEAIDSTIRHLQTCSMAFGDICDPETPGNCAPTMEFPREALATSR